MTLLTIQLPINTSHLLEIHKSLVKKYKVVEQECIKAGMYLRPSINQSIHQLINQSINSLFHVDNNKKVANTSYM